MYLQESPARRQNVILCWRYLMYRYTRHLPWKKHLPFSPSFHNVSKRMTFLHKRQSEVRDTLRDWWSCLEAVTEIERNLSWGHGWGREALPIQTWYMILKPSPLEVGKPFLEWLAAVTFLVVERKLKDDVSWPAMAVLFRVVWRRCDEVSLLPSSCSAQQLSSYAAIKCFSPEIPCLKIFIIGKLPKFDIRINNYQLKLMASANISFSGP